MKLQSTKNKIYPKHCVYKISGTIAVSEQFLYWSFFIFSLVKADLSRRNILHNFLQLWHSCAGYNCIRGTSCIINADHVYPKSLFICQSGNNSTAVVSHFLPWTEHERKHPNTPSFSSGYATLLNIVLLRKLILSVIHGMFLEFESRAHTHVSHLEALPGDGGEILRTINNVIYTMPVLLFFPLQGKKENNLKLFIYKMTVIEKGLLKNLHGLSGDESNFQWLTEFLLVSTTRKARGKETFWQCSKELSTREITEPWIFVYIIKT